MKNLIKIYTILLFSSCLFWTACKTSTSVTKTAPNAPVLSDYVGDWEFEVPDAPVDLTGIFTISKENGVYNAKMDTPEGNMKINDFSIENNVLSGYITVQNMRMELSGEFDNTNYSGVFSVEGTELLMSMTKK